MTTSYSNIVSYLETINYSIKDTLSEYVEKWQINRRNFKFTYKCDKSHETTCSLAIFNNSKLQVKNGTRKSLCSECNKELWKNNSFDTYKNNILEKTGHILLELQPFRECIYKCGNCGFTSSTTLSNLVKKNRSKFCNRCFQGRDPNKEIRPRGERDKIKAKKREDRKREKEESKAKQTKQSFLTENNTEKQMASEKVFNDYYKRIYEKSGNILKSIEIVRTRNNSATAKDVYYNKKMATYECIHCKKIQVCILNSLMQKKRESKCKDCPKNTQLIFQHGYEEIKKIVEERGMKLVDDETTKFKVKTKLNVLCICGEPYSVLLYDIKRGKSCMKCKKIKYKKTCTEIYGVDNTFSSEKIKERILETNRKNYGADYPLLSDRFIKFYNKTMIKNYNSEWYITSEHFKNLMKEKYGNSIPMHCPELFHKSVKNMLSKKIFTFPSGRSDNVMGYEPKALTHLLTTKDRYLKRSINEEEILLNNDIPTFPYVDRSNKNRMYYPDILVKTNEKYKDKNYEFYVEVKSTWTYNMDPETNYEKWNAVAMLGNIIKIFMYSDRELLDIWIFFPYMNKSPRSANKIMTKFDKPLQMARGKIYKEDVDCFSYDIFNNEICKENKE